VKKISGDSPYLIEYPAIRAFGARRRLLATNTGARVRECQNPNAKWQTSAFLLVGLAPIAHWGKGGELRYAVISDTPAVLSAVPFPACSTAFSGFALAKSA